MSHRVVNEVLARVAATLLIIVWAVPLAAAELPKYQVIQTGLLGHTYSAPFDMNEVGNVTGSYFYSPMGDYTHAYLYVDSRLTIDLGTLGGGWRSTGTRSMMRRRF